MPKRKLSSRDKNYLQVAIERVEHACPDETAVSLITAPFGCTDPERNRVSYVANCDRGDAIKMLKELLYRWGHEEEWMKHV